MILLFSTPWWEQLLYWGAVAYCWRTLTGHFAWTYHHSGKTNPTLRPPVETWLVASIPCLAAALVFPIVLLFTMRWPRPRGAEREAERELRGLRYKQLEVSNQHEERVLGIVEDDDVR